MSPLDLESGTDDDEAGAKKRGPGRPKKAETVGDLEKDMREQLEELAEWVRARDPDLAQTFLEDVPRMTKFLSARAGKHERVLRVLKVLFAKDGPLAGARAFGRTARMFAGKLAARRALEDEQDGALWIDEHGNQRDAQGQIVVPHS